MSKEKLKKSIRQAIANDPHKQDILKVSLFGSYAYGKPKPDSDVDILIEYRKDARIGFFELLDTQYNIEKYLNKRVDLLTPSSLSHFFRDEVLRRAEKIYEQKQG